MFLLVVAIEAVVVVAVSLSRLAVLNYLLLPAFFAWLYLNQGKTGVSLSKTVKRVVGFVSLGCVVLFLLALTGIVRDVVYLGLVGGHGYVGLFGAENFAALDWGKLAAFLDVGSLKDVLRWVTFYERFTGIRELIWVHMAVVPGFNIQHLWYTVINGPPAADPFYVTESVLGFSENVNEDTSFGSGLSLMANFLFAGAHGTLFVGMAVMTLLFVFVETVVRNIVRYDSLILFFVMTVILGTWQGDALTTTFQRPIQMSIIGVVLLVLMGMKRRRRDDR
jgi:hypothetical protein